MNKEKLIRLFLKEREGTSPASEEKQGRRLTLLGVFISLIFVAAIMAGIYSFFGGRDRTVELRDKVVEEQVVIPNTTEVSVLDARTPSSGLYEVPLVPQNGERIVVSNAILTLKEGYDSAISLAHEWASDAKLVQVRSLGIVLLDGKSSTWQIAFGSKTKKRGYEIIVQGEKVISKKEVESDTYGFDLPQNWYDSGDAIISLQTLPQFAEATVSSISFYFNTDGKKWGYALTTSRGTTSMVVR